MKTWIPLLTLFGIASAALADGLIVIHTPTHVPHGHYAFAPLEVTYHHVNVKIDGQVAATAIDQEFYNPNPQRLEGTYIFPAPKGAQINKFTMEIGGRQVEAELLPADKARRIYEDIVRKMRDPALLEYAGRDLFKVRIFPIEPHSRKRITLSYSQVLRADSGLVNYIYPLNTEKFSAAPVKTVSVKVELATKRPIKTIYSPSHNVEIRRHGAMRATVGFESKNVRPDTDFQVVFSTEDADVGVNLMTYKNGDGDGYFLLLASPGADIKSNRVVPKDVTFVLDTSGSMAGNKLAQAKKALQFCVENLNDSDRFEIIRFSTEAEPLFDKLVKASEENRQRAADFIKGLKPIGGTAIEEALRRALELRPDRSDRPYVVIFLTDGQPTVGVTDEKQILSTVRRVGGNTRVFCFGIGTDVNTHLLDSITDTTRAFSQYVLPDEDIELKVSSFFTKIKEPVLANPTLRFSGNIKASRVYPSPLPDLFKGEQLIVVGCYSGDGHAAVTIEGTVNGATKKFTDEVEFPSRDTEHDFIPRLWATRRIGFLLDEIRLYGENRELRDEVTELARQYGIVTPYTAYLIVEDESRRNVPVGHRSLQGFDADREAREAMGRTWTALNMDRAGGQAVSGARSSSAFKLAPNAAEAIAVGKDEAQQSVVAASPMPSKAATRVGQYAQQQRFVHGRAFFQNGSQWIDSNVQALPNARRVQVKFNSQEYFDLISQHPHALPWFAVGRNVQVALNNTIYEVTE
ncbi:MAG: VWA domain-containing protein [Verrucomicrobia bacterium]|nr:VWA domain-containing protein [Verrucomicrobiota bacterium]